MENQSNYKEHYESELNVLRQSEQRYKLILENANDLISIQKLSDLSYEYVNKTTLDVLGYAQKELLGKSAIEFIHPEDLPKVLYTIKARIEKGEGNSEFRYRKKDGSYIWLGVTAKVITDEIEDLSLIIISRDITHKKQGEEALRKAYDHLELQIQERIAEYIRINQKLKDEISWRKRIEETLKQQVKSQDLLLKISKQFTSIVTDDIDDMIKTTLQELGEFNEADRCYIVLFSSDGSKINDTHEWYADGIRPSIHILQDLPVDLFPWTCGKLRRFENVYISSTDNLPIGFQTEKELLQMKSAQSLALVPIINENNLIGYLGLDSTSKEIVWSEEKNMVLDLVAQTFSNALQRKQFAQAIKESENYYRTIFENTGAATAILEDDLTISMINKNFEKLSGYLKEEIENKKNWFDFIKEGDQEKVKEYYHLRNTHSEMVPREYEISFISKFGTNRDILIAVDIIPGTLKRAISIVDITLRKQTQKELEDNYSKMQRIMDQTVSSLATAVEIRDPYTAGHQKKLSRLAVAIAGEMGLSKNQIDGISVAGTLHDIGKINVPNEILSKPGKLSEVECMIIKTHCQAGYEIIKGIEFPWPVADIVLQHHERMDGSGYPMGLTGEEILPEARILAVADVIDAMASHRPYRASLGVEAALEEITLNKGILYEPGVVYACLKLFREKGFKLD